ncbi:MAG: ThuA domain-containing protein [Candidatus Hydrogenedentota bacterium]
MKMYGYIGGLLAVAGASAFATAAPLDVAVVTGGHGFEQEAFFAMWKAMDGVDWTHLEHPDANAIYETEGEFPYDVVVLYDMNQRISDAQREAFAHRLDAGEFGLVILHHAFVNYQDWPEYENILGGRYYLTDRDGHAQSTYAHDQQIPVTIAAPDHPVTQGLSDFEIEDETYKGYTVQDGVTPLLRTDHEKSASVIGWTHDYGKGKVVAIQLGHGAQSYASPDYRRLVQNAIAYAAPAWTHNIDTAAAWERGEAVATAAMAASDVAGGYDLMGNGALLLVRPDKKKPFWYQDGFIEEGSWTSAWISLPDGAALTAVETEVSAYGQPQDMAAGWTKFAGNPLVCGAGWKHATEQSLQLPEGWSDRPNDQSLERGHGKYAGQWLLFYNIGGWAVKGWGMAAADSLAPLREGVNPFKDPVRLFEGTGGTHAPNDWIFAEGRWLAPDETKRAPSHMWASTGLETWENLGPMEGIVGHDPGIVYDGDTYYLFTEVEGGIGLCTAKQAEGPWDDQGEVLHLGSHTGDPDVAFFNNRWHMFYDDGPHAHYAIGYAWTTPQEFPRNWRLVRKVYGPHNPEQGQLWDDDTPEGNEFGTGDADMAVEDGFLYLTHERPVGIAWKELQLEDLADQTARLRIEADTNGDGTPDAASGWRDLAGGKYHIDDWAANMTGDLRLRIKLATQNPAESPMITRLWLQADGNAATVPR